MNGKCWVTLPSCSNRPASGCIKHPDHIIYKPNRLRVGSQTHIIIITITVSAYLQGTFTSVPCELIDVCLWSEPANLIDSPAGYGHVHLLTTIMDALRRIDVLFSISWTTVFLFKAVTNKQRRAVCLGIWPACKRYLLKKYSTSVEGSREQHSQKQSERSSVKREKKDAVLAKPNI